MKFLSYSFLLLALLSLTSCASRSPSATVVRFHQNLEQGKIEDAMAQLSSRIRASIPDTKLRPALEKATDDIKAKGGIKKINILKEDVTGEIAHIEYQILFNNGDTRRENTSLSKENKVWKITPNK